MKKTLYTLSVNDYEPDITKITFPLMEKYANKIGADFRIITERKYPDKPPVYEKLQIWELGREHQNDWNIFFDADTLIHPDFFDITSVIGKDTTVSYGSDFTPQRFKPDKYFMRDGRFIGKGNWCLIASDWCLDIWHPLDDISYEEAVSNITPMTFESKSVVTSEHLIDDYIVSRNIARFGLKHILIPEVEKHYGFPSPGALLAHQYLMPTEQKLVWMDGVLKTWGLK